MKKYLSKLTFAVALALVMSLGIAGIAVADPVARERLDVAITKELNMPAGTIVPASSFTFTFAQITPAPEPNEDEWVIGAPAPESVATVPNAVITIPAGTTPITENPMWQVTDVLENATWPHAGDFFFMIRETANTNPTIAANPAERMTYDDSAFFLHVRVANCPVTGNYVPTQAIARVLIGTHVTEGHYVRWGEGPDKIRYYPGTEDPIYDDKLIDPSEIHFINDFARINNLPLEVSKTTVGDYANLSLLFPFEVQLVIPALALAGTPTSTPPGPLFAGPVVGVVVDSTTGDPVVPTRTVTVTGTLPNITVETELSDNESIRFAGLPTGTTFVVTETQHEDYSATADVTIGGALSATSPHGDAGPGSAGDDLTVPATGAYIVTDGGANAADFTNSHHPPTMSGLVITSMPLLAVLIAAAVLLAMMVASRSRQRVEQMPAAF
ncbi:MAG: hypothetical protein FWC99_02845 [Coriobacteriia bacterium]|nr:hypothetical protein [Coriobacteriia bacterium]